MSGNTGRMTERAIRERGPRMRLVQHGLTGPFICREGKTALKGSIIPHTIATSYSLRYLLSIGKAHAQFQQLQSECLRKGQ